MEKKILDKLKIDLTMRPQNINLETTISLLVNMKIKKLTYQYVF